MYSTTYIILHIPHFPYGPIKTNDKMIACFFWEQPTVFSNGTYWIWEEVCPWHARQIPDIYDECLVFHPAAYGSFFLGTR